MVVAPASHMASNDECFNEKMKNLNVKICSGSSVVKVKPLFSHDSKSIIIASGPNIKVYNVQSCECIHVLCYHRTNVISLQENKENFLQFYSCSDDGTVVRWELVEGTQLKVYKVGDNISSFYAPSNDELFYITRKNREQYKLFSVMPSGRKGFITDCVSPHFNAISFGSEGKFVAAIKDNMLCVVELETKKFVRHITGAFKLTCVTCHPKDLSLATGDDKGRIIVWANIFDSKRPIRSIYHWHSLPVSDLSFSSEGSYLYSGGGEAVLTKWNMFSEEKNFLPRLGAPILWIKDSPDSSYVVIALADNSLQFVDPHRNILGVIQGLTQGHFQGNSAQKILSTGLLYDPQTKSVVLNGKPGHLQFYSVFDDKHLFNLDISAKNFISHERENLNYNIDVSKAAIDDRGHWLATVEYWCNNEISPMIWLKFWEYNVISQTFVMNTNIYLPHAEEINSLIFRPYETTDAVPLAVTTSSDSYIKTWTLYDDKESKQSWNGSCMDYYREHLPAGDASYSEDGSVLAVAVDNIATLWTDDNMQLEAILFKESNKEPIKQLRFGRQTCNNLLVCHDGTKIYVWDVLSLTMTFSINVIVQTIASDISSDLMVAMSKDEDGVYQNLYVFKPNSPHPLFIKENVSNKPILSALFVPKMSKNYTSEETDFMEKSQLFFFNEDQCLLTLINECDEDLDKDSAKVKISKNLPMTPFGILQAKQKVFRIKKIEPQKIIMEENVTSAKDSLEYTNPMYTDHLAVCKKLLPSLLRRKLPETAISTESARTKEEDDESKEILFHTTSNKSEDLMDVDIAQETEEVTLLVKDFSFLNSYVSLPMR